MAPKRSAADTTKPPVKRRPAKSLITSGASNAGGRDSASSAVTDRRPRKESKVAIEQVGPYSRHSFRPVETHTDQGLADEMHRVSFQLSRHVVWPKTLAGERAATLHMIEKCSDAVRDRSQIPLDVAKWLSDALLHIARGDSVEEAFNVPRRSKGDDKEGRAMAERSRRYWMAYEAVCRLKLDEEKQLYAFRVIADKYGVSEWTVEDAWKEYRKKAEEEIEMQLKHGGRVMRI